MSWLYKYLERKIIRQCFLDVKYRMKINGSRLREIVNELGLIHLFDSDDILFAELSYYAIKPPGIGMVYKCWDCNYANGLAELEMTQGKCRCGKFLFDPREVGGDLPLWG